MPTDAPEKKTPIPRPRKACTTCRGLKTRCLPDGEHSHPNARCSRCARLGLECVYSRARRGRPPRVPTQSATILNNQQQMHSHSQHPVHADSSANAANGRMLWDIRRPVPVPPLAPSIPQRPNHPTSTNNGLISPQLSLDVISSTWNTVNVPNGSAIIHSTPPNIYETRSESIESPTLHGGLNHTTHSGGSINQNNSPSIHDYLEPKLLSKDSRPLSPASFSHLEVVYPGPIETGIISDAEARLLFTQFMQSIAPCSGLFDAGYHTFDRMQASQPAFTAILATSARFFRPDISNQLTGLTDSLVTRAIMNGDHDLQLIQALLVVVYWRRKPDRTIYLKLGIACRLLCELHIDWSSQSMPPPQTEEQHWRQLDEERTFFNVVSMDLWYSTILQLPPNGSLVLPSVQQVMYWAEQHGHLNMAGDYFKAFITGLWDILKSFAGAHFNLEEVVQFGAWSYDMREKRLVDHLNLWLNSPNLRGTYAGQAQVIGKTTLLKLRVVGFLQSSDPKITCSALLSITEELLTIINQLANSGEILYWYDVCCCVLPMPGVLLHNLRRRFTHEDCSRAVAFCVQMKDIFARLGNVTVGRDETMMGISRLYRKLAKAFEDFKAGTEDPQVAMAIDNILQGVPHWSPLVNVGSEAELLGSSSTIASNTGNAAGGAAPPDWSWMGVQSRWDGST